MRLRAPAKRRRRCTTIARANTRAFSASPAPGWETKGYEQAAHPVQRAAKAAIEDVTGAALGEETRDRRLLDPDLRHPLARAGARLRAPGDRRGLSRAAPPPPRSEFAPPQRRTRR